MNQILSDVILSIYPPYGVHSDMVDAHSSHDAMPTARHRIPAQSVSAISLMIFILYPPQKL